MKDVHDFIFGFFLGWAIYYEHAKGRGLRPKISKKNPETRFLLFYLFYYFFC